MKSTVSALLNNAKSKKKKSISAQNSYLKDIDESSRKVIVKATCKRVIRTNKKAIELLADM